MVRIDIRKLRMRILKLRVKIRILKSLERKILNILKPANVTSLVNRKKKRKPSKCKIHGKIL